MPKPNTHSLHPRQAAHASRPRSATAPEKKPVGRQLICSERRLRQIHPVWAYDVVPPRFWTHRENRRDYLLWLGYKLGFRRMQDWYRITHEDVKRHHGRALAGNYWNASAIEGVKECFPEYDWKEWLFVCAPRAFWKDEANHRRYMDWLGEQLGFGEPEDWYRVTVEDFQRHSGGSFLLWYDSTVSTAVMAYLPDYDWKPWLFHHAPSGVWRSRRTRRRYMKWLGEQLGYTGLDDWYGVKRSDFVAHRGRQLLTCYRDTVALAVMDLVPRRDWRPWMFARTPPGFWQRPENRRRYLAWLGRRLGFRRREDWVQVRRQTFLDNYGGGLVAMYPSHLDLLRECLPEIDWDSRRRYPFPKVPTFSTQQIVKWAERFYEKHGRWPTASSPREPGMTHSWHTIDVALREGIRGLPGGSSLAHLLREHRV
jgi:hypothetical protein